jgi:hypothetical protein
VRYNMKITRNKIGKQIDKEVKICVSQVSAWSL